MFGNDQRGIALITVLWTLTALALLAAAIGDLTRTESVLVRNLGLNIKAEALADAGIHLALASLLHPETQSTQLTFTTADGTVRVSTFDEDGKIDLNTVPADTLVRLLVGLGQPLASAHRIADAIIDYRDRDDSRRMAGAESAAYVQAGLNHGPKNADFGSIEELLLVLGMDRDLFRLIRPAVTTVTGSAAFDPRVAPPEALHALPPTMSAWAKRLTGFEFNEPLQAPLPSSQSVTPTRQLYYTIQSEACLQPQRAQFVRQAMVKLDRRSPTTPFRILEWKRLSIDLPDGCSER